MEADAASARAPEPGSSAPPEQVLWILSVDPTRPADGQLTYSRALIDALAAAGADVTVVHLGTRSPASGASGDTQAVKWRAAGTANRSRLKSVVSRLPAMAYTAGSPEFRRVLEEELARRWDAVVVDHVQSGWAMEQLAARLDAATVVVHVSHNRETEVRRRVASGTSRNPAARAVLELDARKVAALEARILRGAGLVTAIAADDAAAFARVPGCPEPLVLTPGYGGARVAEREITAAVPRRAVIAGSMLWRVKQFDLLALLRVADARFAAAGAEIVVIGEAPPEFAAEVLHGARATTMRGRLDSLSDEFAQARLALVSEPHGGGFKLKTLDYVFLRVPMMVQEGSVGGLPLDAGAGMLEFGSIEALVDGALAVLDDFPTLNALQREAYARCSAEFDWADRGVRLRDAIGRADAARA